jgi:hypothetical protein
VIVTVGRYQAITGDTATAAATVSARIEEAVDLLEEHLDRPLEAIERTEVMWPSRDGCWLWPRATPIMVATGHKIEGDGLRPGALGWLGNDPYPFDLDRTVTVTYTGGWVERSANPSATNRLPVHIERDLAWVAYALGNPNKIATEIPTGVSSVRLGDVAISFAGGSGSRTVDEMSIRWSRRTRSYRRRS